MPAGGEKRHEDARRPRPEPLLVWGNGHATTYPRAAARRSPRAGHDVLFLERDVPWYAAHRDLAEPDYLRARLLRRLASCERWRGEIAQADAVIVGSYVPEGVEVGDGVQRRRAGVTAFYDIDTPVTLAKLARGTIANISRRR